MCVRYNCSFFRNTSKIFFNYYHLGMLKIIFIWGCRKSKTKRHILFSLQWLMTYLWVFPIIISQRTALLGQIFLVCFCEMLFSQLCEQSRIRQIKHSTHLVRINYQNLQIWITNKVNFDENSHKHWIGVICILIC